jgi:hypothetical protein
MDWIIYCLNISNIVDEFNNNLKENTPEDTYLNICKVIYNKTLPNEKVMQIYKEKEEFKNILLNNFKELWRFQDCFNGIVDGKPIPPVNYWKNNDLFLKLKRYADGKKIITKYRSCDDLMFLTDTEIIFADVSNVTDYRILFFRLGEKVILHNVLRMIDQGLCYIKEYKFENDILSIDDVIKSLDIETLKTETEIEKINKINKFLNDKSNNKEISVFYGLNSMNKQIEDLPLIITKKFLKNYETYKYKIFADVIEKFINSNSNV